MRRATAILTVLATLVFVPSASAGQATEQHGNTVVPTKLIKQYDQLKKRAERQRAVVTSCKSAEKAIVYYRQQVWSHQKELHEAPSPTNYPERKLRACAYKKWVAGNWQAIAREYHKQIKHFDTNPKAAICYVFGSYCSQALVVTWCESRHDRYAQNGQYLGLFQMGDFARGKYGHSTTAIGQARAAHAYFMESGRDWSPWSCKPW